MPQGSSGRIDRRYPFNVLERGDGYVFEFIRNDVAGVCERAQCDGVVECALNNFAAGCCGRIIRRIQEAAFDIQIAGGEAKHLAELPGANYSYPHGLILSGRCRPEPCRSGSCGTRPALWPPLDRC